MLATEQEDQRTSLPSRFLIEIYKISQIRRRHVKCCVGKGFARVSNDAMIRQRGVRNPLQILSRHVAVNTIIRGRFPTPFGKGHATALLGMARKALFSVVSRSLERR